MIPDSIRLNLGEDFEFFRSQDGEWMYLGNVSFEAAYESGIWKMDNARLSYLLTQRNGGDFRQYVELGMDNRISLPLSFFADASFMMRLSLDGKPGVPIFFRDGFELVFRRKNAQVVAFSECQITVYRTKIIILPAFF